VTAAGGLGAMGAARAVPAGPPGTIRSVAGTIVDFRQFGFSGDNGPAAAAQLYHPRAVTFDRFGNAFVADTLNNRIRRIDPGGTITTVAGNGVEGYGGDDGPALAASMFQPHGVAVDGAGNLFIADSGNNRIRWVDPNGVMRTLAGTGASDSVGDGGPATAAALKDPKAVQVSGGQVLVADAGNNKVRVISLGSGTIATLAGMTKAGYGGDAGPAKNALLNSPRGLWVTRDGSVYISDTDNHRVRRVAPDGIITTIAGTGTPGSGGDGGPALAAQFNEPRGIASDAAGNIYVAEEIGQRIRRIDTRGRIWTIAGNGVPGLAGDDGPAEGARFDHIRGLGYDGRGNLWVADTYNNRMRMISAVAQAPSLIVPPGVALGPAPGGTDAPGGPAALPRKSGYWMLGVDGKVYPFGDAASLGDTSPDLPVDLKAIHIVATPTGRGYWILDNSGAVSAFGDAFTPTLVPAIPLQGKAEKVTSLSPTPSGQGYWIFTNKGRVFAFGDAVFHGDLSGTTLNGSVKSSVATPSGQGYFMVASDGGVFAFGDALFRGSMGATKLNRPVESLVPSADGAGYWLVASDGGIFAFGNAPFRGSMGATRLNKPVVGMVRFGSGYLMVAADGGVFNFSDRPFSGSLGDNPPTRPIVYVATLDVAV
jgi:sugar lactone lactonase YvrE